MEKEQTHPEDFRNLEPSQTSKFKQNLATETQKNKSSTSSSGLSKKTKGKEKLLPTDVKTKKTKEKNELVSKEGKTESEKQGKKKNKKNTNVIKHACTRNEVKEKANTKSAQVQLVTGPNVEVDEKVQKEISRSKRRRIRKKKLLESLGINLINSVDLVKSKKKRKKSKVVDAHDNTCKKPGNCSEVISNSQTDLKCCGTKTVITSKCPVGSECCAPKAKDINSGLVDGKTNSKGPRLQDTKCETQKVKNKESVTKKKEPQIPRQEASKLEKKSKSNLDLLKKTKVSAEINSCGVKKSECSECCIPKAKDISSGIKDPRSQGTKTNSCETRKVKGKESTVPATASKVTKWKEIAKKSPETTKVKKNSGSDFDELKRTKVSCGKACSNREESQLRCTDESSTNSIEDTSHKLINKEEEDEKVNLVNLLSHDNVEGLFRSALLNDVTLSSRCSEKEVKNFFNTYGTFSERGRTQFAAVEKLLNSTNKDDATSEYFEPALDKEICLPLNLQNSDANKFPVTVSEGDLLSRNCTSELALGGPPDSFAKGDDISVFKGGFTRGPIYTSPNTENRVTNSADSSQILNRTFVTPCDSSPVSHSELENSTDVNKFPVEDSPIKSNKRTKESDISANLEEQGKLVVVNENKETQAFDKDSTIKFEGNNPETNCCPNVQLTDTKKNFEVISNSKSLKDNFEDSLANTEDIHKSKRENKTKEEIVGTENKSFEQNNKAVKISPTISEFIIPSNSVLAPVVQENTMKSSQSKEGEGKNVPKTDKSREEIVAEREAKKAAKLAAKNKSKGPNAASASSQAVNALSKQESDKQHPKSATEVSVPASEVKKVKDKEEKPAEGKVEAMSEGKSKAELRAERRAKQEAQRAAKVAAAAQQQASSSSQVKVDPKEKSLPKRDVDDGVSKKTAKSVVQSLKPKVPEHKVKLFNHLYSERGPLAITEGLMLTGSDLHPAIVKLGVQYAERVVVGSNARCIALLDALKQVIKDYETPPQKEFSRGLEAELQLSMDFLDTCRPRSVSMTNALRHLKRQLTLPPNKISDSEAKKKLLDAIDTYVREQIDMAAQAICIMVQRKIANGDVILTYGCSSLLQRILLEAHTSGTKFRVVVVDGCPWREGREMLRRLVERGLDCSYVLVSAASFIMREVTKVFLGAHALLANGYVMSRAGSSQVALLAHSYNVPVLVCCETHKFCERVQTDSFVYNELGNPDDLVRTASYMKESPLSKWRGIGSLTPLNLTYDVTPPDLVTAVVTELGILPCTSVPVILRIKPSEIGS